MERGTKYWIIVASKNGILMTGHCQKSHCDNDQIFFRWRKTNGTEVSGTYIRSKSKFFASLLRDRS